MTKTQVQSVVRRVVKENGNTLTREEKWEVFFRVCSNLLRDNKITQQQYNSWTNPF